MKGLILVFLIAGIFLFIPTVKAADHIVINEIQLAGQSASDEFIELYNPTSSDVDLSGWSIQYKSATGVFFQKYNFPADVISAGGYFIVAHNKFNGTHADLQHQSFGLSSTGGNVYLVASQEKLEIGYEVDKIIDKVAWGTGNDPETLATVNVPASLTSLNRIGGIDTDNNAADFIIQTATPGSVNVVTEEEPEVIPEVADESVDPEPIVENNEPEVINSEEEITSENIYPSTGNIIINELLPNPEGLDSQNEWIEIKSNDTQTVNLNGWRVADLSRSFTLEEAGLGGLLIEPGEFLLIDRQDSGIALNNTGSEKVSLFDFENRMVDSIIYKDEIDEGQAWARTQSGFVWTTSPTPGATNIISETSYEYNDNGANEDLDLPNQVVENQSSDFNDSGSEFTEEAENNSMVLGESDIDYSTLLINELLPNPVGSDEEGEWIELYNKGYQQLNISGIKVGDSSGKVYEIPGAVIEPGGYLILTREMTNISLNNDGDEIKLWSPDGSYLTASRYFGSAVEGEAYALSASGLWDWTTRPTPEEVNIFSSTLGLESGGDESDIDQPYSSFKRSIKPNFLNNSNPDELAPTLADVRSESIGTPITVRGIVVVEPKIFAKTYFYIADNRHGIRVYSSKGEFPALARGDLIEVKGEMSQSNEELRIKIANKDGIEVITSGAEPDSQEVELSEIGENLEGSLVQITGDVTSIKSSNIYLDDFESEVRVYVPQNTGIDISIYQPQDKLRIVGIVSQTKAGYRVMPRDQEDIKIVNGEAVGVGVEPVLVQNRATDNSIYLFLIPLVVALLGIIFLIINKRYKWISFAQKKSSGD